MPRRKSPIPTAAKGADQKSSKSYHKLSTGLKNIGGSALGRVPNYFAVPLRTLLMSIDQAFEELPLGEKATYLERIQTDNPVEFLQRTIALITPSEESQNPTEESSNQESSQPAKPAKANPNSGKTETPIKEYEITYSAISSNKSPQENNELPSDRSARSSSPPKSTDKSTNQPYPLQADGSSGIDTSPMDISVSNGENKSTDKSTNNSHDLQQEDLKLVNSPHNPQKSNSQIISEANTVQEKRLGSSHDDVHAEIEEAQNIEPEIKAEIQTETTPDLEAIAPSSYLCPSTDARPTTLTSQNPLPVSCTTSTPQVLPELIPQEAEATSTTIAMGSPETKLEPIETNPEVTPTATEKTTQPSVSSTSPERSETTSEYMAPTVPQTTTIEQKRIVFHQLFRAWRTLALAAAAQPWDVPVSISILYKESFRTAMEGYVFYRYLSELEGVEYSHSGGAFLALVAEGDNRSNVEINGRNVSAITFSHNQQQRHFPTQRSTPSMWKKKAVTKNPTALLDITSSRVDQIPGNSTNINHRQETEKIITPMPQPITELKTGIGKRLLNIVRGQS